MSGLVPGRQFASGRAVPRTPELDRILGLARREWEPDAPRLADKLTQFLRVPGGSQKLRDIQAAALRDLHDYGGLFGPIRAGGGKTLFSLLAAIVVNSQRPVLLLPAKLIEKTRKEMNALRKHWLIPGFIRILSYEKLGRQQYAEELNLAKPDLLIMDEAHKVKNPRAAVTKRVKRYIEANRHCRVVAISGTLTKRSLLDFAHIAEWCLPRTNPTPHPFDERQMWAYVLDERKELYEELDPGALLLFCNEEERALSTYDPKAAVRRAFRRRLVQTPGVVASQEGALGTSLRIETVQVPLNPDWYRAITLMRATWTRPDGLDCFDAMEVWRHLRELACGFFYRWNPTPPQPWKDARQRWARFVRDVLRNNRSGIDSEAQVVAAIERDGKYEREAWDEWRKIKDTFQPNTEAVWLTTEVLDFCHQWALGEEEGRKRKPIIWVEHTAFGRELARRTGWSFYWRQGQDAKGRAIEDHPPGEPLIASIASNSEGRNLQAWCDNLVVSWPPTGSQCEQLLARTHRDGQLEDEVVCAVMMNIREQALAFEKSRRDAQYITDILGQEQRLSYGDVLCMSSDDPAFSAR